MSKFNKTSVGTKTTNLAGGEAFKQSPEMELVSILLTSFVKDQFYKTTEETLATFRDVIKLCDPYFVAQAGVYARTVFGMRSITHVLASEIARYSSGKPWGKNFFDKIIYRLDDMLEITAYHTGKGDKITNAMKKGFASALNRFDRYAIAKYRGESKDIKLVDLVNLIHPKVGEKAGAAISELVKGELKSVDTWEAKLSEAGQKAETEEQKEELKADAWKELIREKKIKYFALLRNLRNIITQAPDMTKEALAMLVNETLIKKSLILPFQFQTAYDEMQKIGNREAMVAVDKAMEIALSNVPIFDGKTLIAMDTSGSMSGQPHKIGSLFAAVLYKVNDADMLCFDGYARYITPNPSDSIASITKMIPTSGGSTNFHSIFEQAQKKGEKYDRIIILSDMQGWVGYNNPTGSFSNYKNVTGAKSRVYSFDLAGNGTLQFPENDVYAIAGFSEKIFDVMKVMEQDKNALINTIKKITL